MNSLGFSAVEISAICAVLAAIYHIGVAGVTKSKTALCLSLIKCVYNIAIVYVGLRPGRLVHIAITETSVLCENLCAVTLH